MASRCGARETRGLWAALLLTLGLCPAACQPEGDGPLDAKAPRCGAVEAFEAQPRAGNHTLTDLRLSLSAAVPEAHLEIVEGDDGADFTLDLGALVAGPRRIPLFGLLPETLVRAELRWRSGADTCTRALSFQTPAVRREGLPPLTGERLADAADVLTGVLMVMEGGVPKGAWMRRGQWVYVGDASDLRAAGRRMLVLDDGRLELLGEVVETDEPCRLITMDVDGTVLGTEDLDAACHHSYQRVDVDGDGIKDALVLGLDPRWEGIAADAAVPIYADLVQWGDPGGVSTLVSYADFIDVPAPLLDLLAEDANPDQAISQDATYANTLQCTDLGDVGVQCLAGLNLASTGLVHLDIQADEVHVVANDLSCAFALPTGGDVSEGCGGGLRWQGLEALSFNGGAARAAGQVPFAGVHSAQVIAWDPSRRILRFVGHERGFNIETLIGGPSGGGSVLPEAACAQTVVYEVDLGAGTGRIVDAATPTLDDGRCAHSLYTGDVNLVRNLSGELSVTSLYTGYRGGGEVWPALWVRYALSDDGHLKEIARWQLGDAPQLAGFHTAIGLADLNQRLAR